MTSNKNYIKYDLPKPSDKWSGLDEGKYERLSLADIAKLAEMKSYKRVAKANGLPVDFKNKKLSWKQLNLYMKGRLPLPKVPEVEVEEEEEEEDECEDECGDDGKCPIDGQGECATNDDDDEEEDEDSKDEDGEYDEEEDDGEYDDEDGEYDDEEESESAVAEVVAEEKKGAKKHTKNTKKNTPENKRVEMNDAMVEAIVRVLEGRRITVNVHSKSEIKSSKPNKPHVDASGGVKFRMKGNKLYLDDNGEVICRECAGNSAKGGFTLRGQPVIERKSRNGDKCERGCTTICINKK